MGKNIMHREFIGKVELVIKYEGKIFGQDQYCVYVDGKQYGESTHAYSGAQQIAVKAKEEISRSH